ncbi:MAG: flavodoxin [Oscillospiraceae bacterium]|jgi:flavodoxin|nr:flavodoxin [Oscillospiraceae bacterium]
MNIAVRYQSKTGHTAKVADAIAAAVGVSAEPISVPVAPDTDLLFLGGALYMIYGCNLDPALVKFIAELPKTVKRAALFGTSALMTFGNKKMLRRFRKAGIEVCDETFHCYGEFKGLQVGHPDETDLEDAAKWAGRQLTINN